MDSDEKTNKLAWALLGLAGAGSAALILSLTAGFTFITDEWDLVLMRPGWSPDSFLAPFHEHIVLAPALIYKLLQAAFGIDSPRPMQLVATGAFLAVGLLLFIWLRRRVGEWAALIGAVIVLFLGAAFEDLLWAFQVGYFGSLACGIGALIALDRDDRRGDLTAAVLLVAGMAFSSLGLPFALGAAIEWLSNPRARGRRWFVPAAPLLFYGLWWIGWGHEAESAVRLANLPDSPKYVFDAASAAMTSMLGLATGDGSEPDQPHLIWGRLALAALLGLSTWRLVRLGRIPRGVLVTGGIAVAFFGLAALGHNELRPPTSSRYQLPAVVFILLFGAELLRGVRIPTAALGLAAAVVVATSIAGVGLMKDAADQRWKPSAVANQASLGAIVVAGPAARPGYELNLGLDAAVPIERFREAVASGGSPGYSPEEIAGLDPAYRDLADRALIDALGLELSGADPGPRPRNCGGRPVRSDLPVAVRPGPAPLEIHNPAESPLTVKVARFGDPPGSPIGSIYPRSRAWLTLPPDGTTRPWRITLEGGGNSRICR